MSPPPRATIGIPTYNRAERLARAVESALSQTYDDLELVIADNASTDATAELCADLLASDRRVRVIRQPVNVGLTGNFNRVLAQARGEFVMVLADDDWLDGDYLERCITFLDAHGGHVLASGRAMYHDPEGRPRGFGVAVDCEQDSPSARVRCYFGHVQDNASIYGVMRSAPLQRCLPMPNALAGDWMLIGRLLMHGKLATLSSTTLHRTVGGTSASYAQTVRSMGLTRFEARAPHLAIAANVRADIARGSPAYDPLSNGVRRRLAWASAASLLRARPLDVLDDLVRPLRAIPGVRRMDAVLRSRLRRRRSARAYVA